MLYTEILSTINNMTKKITELLFFEVGDVNATMKNHLIKHTVDQISVSRVTHNTIIIICNLINITQLMHA